MHSPADPSNYRELKKVYTLRALLLILSIVLLLTHIAVSLVTGWGLFQTIFTVVLLFVLYTSIDGFLRAKKVVEKQLTCTRKEK